MPAVDRKNNTKKINLIPMRHKLFLIMVIFLLVVISILSYIIINPKFQSSDYFQYIIYIKSRPDQNYEIIIPIALNQGTNDTSKIMSHQYNVKGYGTYGFMNTSYGIGNKISSNSSLKLENSHKTWVPYAYPSLIVDNISDPLVNNIKYKIWVYLNSSDTNEIQIYFFLYVWHDSENKGMSIRSPYYITLNAGWQQIEVSVSQSIF
jgi:hypothetical protein